MREYDLYVPMVSDTGKRFPPGKLGRLKKLLVSEFGGFTYFPQKSKGVWRIGRISFRDDIVIIRVLGGNTAKVRSFWRKFKKRMQAEWNQKMILIVVRKVRTV